MSSGSGSAAMLSGRGVNAADGSGTIALRGQMFERRPVRQRRPSLRSPCSLVSASLRWTSTGVINTKPSSSRGQPMPMTSSPTQPTARRPVEAGRQRDNLEIVTRDAPSIRRITFALVALVLTGCGSVRLETPTPPPVPAPAPAGGAGQITLEVDNQSSMAARLHIARFADPGQRLGQRSQTRCRLVCAGSSHLLCPAASG